MVSYINIVLVSLLDYSIYNSKLSEVSLKTSKNKNKRNIDLIQ